MGDDDELLVRAMGTTLIGSHHERFHSCIAMTGGDCCMAQAVVSLAWPAPEREARDAALAS